MDLTRLNEQLAPFGLEVFGWFEMFNGPAELTGKASALIGNRGGTMWRAFAKSDFANDGAKNPLDRWTKHIISPLAVDLKATALYPFLDNSNHHRPFQQWAKRATNLHQSPLGLLIDPEYGLWHAFRAVLVFDQPVDINKPTKVDNPCNQCAEKPCLSTCPVGAVSKTKFDAGLCNEHVICEQNNDCSSNGCIARNACPVGKNHTYTIKQQAFHMRAFKEVCR